MILKIENLSKDNKNIKNKSKLESKRSWYDIAKDHQLVLIIITFLLTLYSIRYTQTYATEYAIVNKSGSIAYEKKF
jgi:hypothetical protein